MEANSSDPQTPAPPAVQAQIPCAVAESRAGSSWSWLTIAGGGIVAGIVIMMMPRKKPASDFRPTAPAQAGSPIPDATPAWPPAPPIAIARVFPFGSSTGGRMGQAEELLQARMRSPMVIYNGGTSGGGVLSPLLGRNAPSGAGPFGQGPAGPGASGPGGSPSAAEGGAPLPRGFAPKETQISRSGAIGDREYVITQGKLLDAVLETAINSDHPGLLRALLSDDTYGDTGRTVLLPRGTRLVGEYDSNINKGQNRVFILWKRAIRPDGIDIELGSAGTDPLGETGLDGRVNNHFWTMFGAAALLSIIGATASTAGVAVGDQPNSLANYREALTNGFGEAANNVLGQFTRIKPTITVRQGMPVKVFVARDLYFDADALAQVQGPEVVP